MPKLMRCLVEEIAVAAPRAEYGRRMGAGLVVDFDEVIIPAAGEKAAYTLGDALAGRHDCFEELNVTADGGPAPVGFTTPLIDPETDLSHATIAPIADAKE